jgi:hypothetical protein
MKQIYHIVAGTKFLLKLLHEINLPFITLAPDLKFIWFKVVHEKLAKILDNFV